MNNFGKLIKVNFLVFWGSLKNSKKTGRNVFSGTMMFLLIAFFGLMMAFQSVMQTTAFIQEGYPELSVFQSLMSSLTIGFLFGLMRSATSPASKDADMLLSLPIRKIVVILSKVVTQYIFDGPLILLIFIPSVVSYYAMAVRDPAMLTRGLILAFLLPLLPIAVSYLLGTLISILREKFRMTGILTTIVLMLIVVGYMFINFQSSGLLAQVSDGGKVDSAAMIGKFPPLSWLTHAVLDGGMLPILFSLLMILVPFWLSMLLFASRFGRPESGYRSTSRVLGFEVKSPRMSLLQKEVRRYLSCTIYLFNTAFGPLLLIIFAAAVAIMGPEKIVSSMNIPVTAQDELPMDMIYVILSSIFFFFPAVTSTSASSISLEGKQLWILKVHPARTSDIFWSKYMLNILLMVPVSILAIFAVGIRAGMPLPGILGLTVATSLLGILMSLAGLIVNLWFPRFDWTSETSVVKQSMSVMMTMLAGFAFVALPIVLHFTLLSKYGFYGFVLTSISIYALLTGAAYLYLNTKGKKIFESL